MQWARERPIYLSSWRLRIVNIKQNKIWMNKSLQRNFHIHECANIWSEQRTGWPHYVLVFHSMGVWNYSNCVQFVLHYRGQHLRAWSHLRIGTSVILMSANVLISQNQSELKCWTEKVYRSNWNTILYQSCRQITGFLKSINKILLLFEGNAARVNPPIASIMYKINIYESIYRFIYSKKHKINPAIG